jgi:hypothetical protein
MGVKDEIDFDPLTFTYGNIGRTRHVGIEAEVRWRQYSRASPSLVYASTHVHPIVEEDAGRQLKNIPRHLWKPALMLQLPGDIGATIAYTRAAGRFLDDQNAFPLSDSSSIDVRIAKRVHRALATVDLLNVTDDKFEEFGFAVPDLRGMLAPFYFPGPGFAARVGVEFRF